MAILKPFLGEEEIHKETKEPHHTCCDLCMSKCNCDNCYRDLFALEQMLKDTLSESYSDATEIYEEQDEFDAFMSSDFEFEWIIQLLVINTYRIKNTHQFYFVLSYNYENNHTIQSDLLWNLEKKTVSAELLMKQIS